MHDAENDRILARGKSSNGDGAFKRRARTRGNRGVAGDDNLKIRAVLAAFRHRGEPSFRTARDVGRELGLSRQAVSTILMHAFADGLFRVDVELPLEVSEVVRLESAVLEQYKAYGLRRVLLVHGAPEMAEDLDRERGLALRDQIVETMAARVSEYLEEVLAGARWRCNDRSFLLGVAWGRTLHRVAKYLLGHARKRPFSDLEVVPIVGITSASNPDPVEANVVAMDVARAYGGRSSQLPCQAFAPSLEANLLMSTRQVQRMLAKIRRCDAVITSMGPIPEQGDDIRLSGDPEMSRELYYAARGEGAIGELCFWLFDRNGAEVKTSHAAIGIGFAGLQRIAADPKRQVILVAGGDRRRFEPLKVALQARLASVLVSDTVTARYLIGEI